MAHAVKETHFDAPPAYVAAWLTDFREDDGQRYFGHAKPGRIVERRGDLLRTEGDLPMGRIYNTIRITGPLTWEAEGEVRKGSKMLVWTQLKESVRAEGTGSLHRVEATMEPRSFGMKLFSPILGILLRKQFARGFAQMKPALEADYKAGKPPAA